MGHVRVCNREIHGSPAARVLKVTFWAVLGVVGVGALAVLFGLLVQWLWNALMPDIFGLPVIGYWQAVGLVVLAHILFGSGHNVHSRKSRKVMRKGTNGTHFHIESNGRSVSCHSDNSKSGQNPCCFDFNNGNERHWDSFREFWNDYGKEAFDKWLNGKGKPSSDVT